ncbi:MAG: DUF134 domain-containing protein [Lachnospiraceae bacterium]|nr:DUF134 domain-containing protein [Lachnospiraceae bacterium]
MARPKRCRRICIEPEHISFSPEDSIIVDTLTMTLDEYEVIRLVDLEKITHEQCASRMNISRTTVTEIYETARTKLADSLVNGKRLIIAGGNYTICDGSAQTTCNKVCHKAQLLHTTILPKPTTLLNKERTTIMRIAVTYENGQIFQHFGHTSQFKIYDVNETGIENAQVIDTNGQGHGALAGFLTQNNVDVLICGGIGGGAQMALAQMGIQLFGGVSGNADDAVNAFLTQTLTYNPNVRCNHHDHEHGNGEHTCGNHGCGSDSCH